MQLLEEKFGTMLMIKKKRQMFAILPALNQNG